MNPTRLGQITLITGDHRTVSASIKNITSFSGVSAVLKNGDTDVTSTYISTTPSYAGNVLISDKIGGKATIPPGNYRYFITATYETSKNRTWYWDVIVLPKDLSAIEGVDITVEDYDPMVGELTLYEGDNTALQVTVPNVELSAASGELHLFLDDVTATYCSGSANYSGNLLTTHDIGGLASIPPGEYAYFITGTFDNGDVKATWFFKILVLGKQGVV